MSLHTEAGACFSTDQTALVFQKLMITSNANSCKQTHEKRMRFFRPVVGLWHQTVLPKKSTERKRTMKKSTKNPHKTSSKRPQKTFPKNTWKQTSEKPVQNYHVALRARCGVRSLHARPQSKHVAQNASTRVPACRYTHLTE